MKTPLTTTTVTSLDHAKCGDSVRERREAKNKSLRWLAHRMKVSPAFLSDLERGRRNWTRIRFEQAHQILFDV